MTTPSALSKVASQHFLDAQPPLLSQEGTNVRLVARNSQNTGTTTLRSATCPHTSQNTITNLRSSPCAQFQSSDPVLVRVIAIRDFKGKSAIAVAFPSAAEINGIVNSSDLIIAADAKADRIILAVAHIRKSDSPEN